MGKLSEIADRLDCVTQELRHLSIIGGDEIASSRLECFVNENEAIAADLRDIQTPEAVNQQLLDALRQAKRDFKSIRQTTPDTIETVVHQGIEALDAVIAAAEAQQAPADESAKGQEPC